MPMTRARTLRTLNVRATPSGAHVFCQAPPLLVTPSEFVSRWGRSKDWVVTPPDGFDMVKPGVMWRAGTVVNGKWRIDAVRGQGGMATVYAATHRNGSRVAIKVLHAELCSDADIRARFLREGYVANAVDHPGAVHVFDDDVAEDGSVFLVMELLEGDPLDVVWRRGGGQLSEADVLGLVAQLLDVLAAAHSRGIIHRDIKPQNIFLTRSGTLKVLDFGIARVTHRPPGGGSATAVGAFMGSPAYVAPEQARGRAELVDQRTDLWAVGATMFTLLTGRHVHGAGTACEQLAAAMTCNAPALAEIIPSVSLGCAQVVDRALAYVIEDRWPDARTMQQAVRAARMALATSPTHEPCTVVLASRVSGPAPGPAISSHGSTTSGAVTREAIASTRGRKRWLPVALVAGGSISVLALTSMILVRPGSQPHREVAAAGDARGATSISATIVVPPPPSPPPDTPKPPEGPPAEPEKPKKLESGLQHGEPPPGDLDDSPYPDDWPYPDPPKPLKPRRTETTNQGGSKLPELRDPFPDDKVRAQRTTKR